MKTITNPELPLDTAIVIIDIPPYGRVKLGDDKKTAFPELNTLIADLYLQVDCSSEEGFPSVTVANLLIDKYDGEITRIEYPFAGGKVY